MPSFRALFFASLFSTHLSAAVISSPAESQDLYEEIVTDATAFQQLLQQVRPSDLHAALHNFSPTRYKHGSFKGDREAAEAIHHLDPVLATSMVTVAKRQTSDNTTSTPVDAGTTSSQTSTASSTADPTPTASPTDVSSTTSIVTESSTPTTVVVTSTSTPSPIPASSTSEAPSTSTTQAPASTSPVETTTDNSSPTTVAGLSSSTPVSTITDVSNSQSSESSSSSRASATSAEPSSTSSLHFTSSYNTKSSHTSVVLRTTTLPNGALQTLTSVTVVNGPQAAETGSSTGTAKNGPAGSLQSQGSAAGNFLPRVGGWKMVGVMGAAVGFAWGI